MAHAVKETLSGPSTDLRKGLDRGERLIVKPTRENVLDLLRQLDEIEALLERLEEGGLDVRSERGRFESLQRKVSKRAADVVRAAGGSRGLSRMRDEYAADEHFWWYLDEDVSARQRKQVSRFMRSLLILVGIFAGIWILLTYVFPPDPDVILASDAVSAIQDMAVEGEWQEALARARETRAQMSKEDIELLLWEAVLAEKLNQPDEAREALAAARLELTEDQEALFWATLGNVRLTMGDLTGAEADGERALAADESEPQAYFLLGAVAEQRGQTNIAVDYFQQTFDLAIDSNPQLAVIAKVRQGTLIQRAPVLETDTAQTPQTP